MPRPPHAIVTAGGTAEPIDDVRVVTNNSSGRFGAAIANAFAASGVRTTMVGSKAMLSHPDWLDPRVRRVPFTSFADLQAALTSVIEGDPPDWLLMAAAVSDYSPTPEDGKIRSNRAKLTIKMQRNPKLLARLREQCGEKAFLVGFKLLSNVSRQELVDVARKQVISNRLNLTVANDLSELKGPRHPVTLVTADHEHRVDDVRDGVAERLVGYCIQRGGHAVTASPMYTPGLWCTPGDSTHERWTRLHEYALSAARKRGIAGPYRLEPAVREGRLVGAVARLTGGVSPFVNPEQRGNGVGAWLLNLIGASGHDLVASEEEVPWFIARGCQVVRRSKGIATLVPPSRRDDLRTAASVCLFHEASGEVLVGRRGRPPGEGQWAFPGGGADPGESPAAAASRELEEETGISENIVGESDRYYAGLRTSDNTASGPATGDQAWAIDHFVVRVKERIDPCPTDEFEGIWMAIDEALTLRPLTPGTEAALRRLRGRIEPG